MPTAVMIEIQGEDDVEEDDLHDRRSEGDGADRVLLLVTLQHVVGLHRAFHDQEGAAADQDHIAPGDVEVENRENRLGQPDDPGQREQQHEAPDQGQCQADPAGRLLLVFRQTSRNDRQEDQVIDAEDNLQRGKRQQTDPDLIVGQHLEHLASGPPICFWAGVGGDVTPPPAGL